MSKPPGCALLLPTEAVDAWRFESLLNTTLQGAARAPERAWNRVDDALALWQGGA